MDWKEKKVLVFGAGISGISAAALLLSQGASALLYDGNEQLDQDALCAKTVDKAVSLYGLDPAAAGQKLRIICGDLPAEMEAKVEAAVLSPGVPTDLPLVERMKANGVRILGEVELAYGLGQGRVYAVTGTNGKTTTTTLLGELMKAAHAQVSVVGNIGNPYTDMVLEQTPKSITVAELSSFQLETVRDFHPAAAVMTNITEDHLNRHHTMENYIACKMRVAENQTAEDLLVLNYEDEVLREFAQKAKAQVVFFSSVRKLEKGLYLDGKRIVCSDGGSETEIVETDKLQIVGLHNYENVMAAVAVALFDGMDISLIRQVLEAFPGVEHRIEYVGTFAGVKYYNDSKGTNPAAAIKGICAMQGPTYLIAGGYDKQSAYEEWINCFDGRVKKLVLIGQTKEKIAEAAKRCGFPAEDIVFCEDLKEATAYCKANALPGEEVLLSPACASWGQFDNYEQRGDMFKAYVREQA